jgi:dolichol-phosphate mannosyltransferase
MKISIVIPAFNESANIHTLHQKLTEILHKTSYDFEFIFIDDGSIDNTFETIKSLSEIDPRVFYIELSRNFGHQSAIKAGIDNAKGDCLIMMDCDLQHPPEIIKKMIAIWEMGYDIVYTKRREDKKLPWFKRKASSLYYSLFNYLVDFKLESGTADFRLMTRNVIDAFSRFSENELFFRGLIKWAGFKQAAVEYDPGQRYSGKTKYSFPKMISFGLRGISSFSIKPLKLIFYLGTIFFLASLFLVVYALLSYFLGKAVSGWTSTIIAIFFFGGLQMLMIGVISLYLSKLVIQSKHRPQYFIRQTNYKIK